MSVRRLESDAVNQTPGALETSARLAEAEGSAPTGDEEDLATGFARQPRAGRARPATATRRARPTPDVHSDA
ncbi:hypothetical protein EVAR_17543_1 [Eumeta japonica]|uniref:Uncharacterized protein n=1 Tax=Eumeta variegata TaxID=151549 RepID=A0A4C1WTK9_EUMVA|nr:hypothetical protein EVAR_17543_1 [Eumeta japonica]